MGYNHFRFARRVGTAVQLHDITKATMGTISLASNGDISILAGTGDDISFYSGATRSGRIEYASNVTIVLGGAVTGDDLILKANTIDDRPYIALEGDSRILLSANAQTDFSFGGSLMGRMKPGGDGLGASIHLKETTTPSAVANYGAIYTKSDNHLYWQSGAGVEYDLGGA
ncbi:MAG: hypothetical protein DRH97_03250 [Chloroflexi bacterium]|nr:MAG: hypothetical protein DRH97_03250 [Chloroflexota bacterium]